MAQDRHRRARMSRRTLARALALAGIIAAIWLFTHNDHATALFRAEELRRYVADAGIYGPLVFVALFITATLLFFPPTAFTLSSGFLFGPLVGLALSIACINTGGLLLFLASRKLGREGLARMLPGRLRDLDTRVADHGLLTVIALRLSFVPFGLVCAAMGVSAVRTRDFALGTLVGTFPAAFMLCWLGDGALEIVRTGSLSALLSPLGLISLLLFAGAAGFPLWLERRRAMRTAPKNKPLRAESERDK
jgi:uncharacterized membrane protein YdjX (TVP38/TMEM64 family)